MAFVKLHEQLLDSSIMEAALAVRWVWVVCLLYADRDGTFRATPQALARRANVSLEEAEEALDYLQQPDPQSTSPDEDGRRLIQTSPNTWKLVNYELYRSMLDPDEQREKAAERQRRKRLRDAGLPEEAGPCAYCGDPATGPDHVVPRSEGGTDVVLCCPRCNNHKARRSLVDFLNDRYSDFVNPELVLANPVLRKYVRLERDKWVPVTPVTFCNDNAEAEAEAEAEAVTQHGARDRAPGSFLPEVLSYWNSKQGLPAVDADSILKPQSANGKRRQKTALVRLGEHPSLEDWQTVIDRIAARPYCLGENDSGWRADVEYLFRVGTFDAYMTGKFSRPAGGRRPAGAVDPRLQRIRDDFRGL